jgi:hypothetical protein
LTWQVLEALAIVTSILVIMFACDMCPAKNMSYRQHKSHMRSHIASDVFMEHNSDGFQDNVVHVRKRRQLGQIDAVSSSSS